MDTKEKARLYRISHKLTRQQWLVLLMFLLREHMEDYLWGRCWNETMQRRMADGERRIDGNRACGRMRTIRSLPKLGLLAHESGSTFSSALTDLGRQIAISVPDNMILVLPDMARHTFRIHYRPKPESTS